MKKIHILLIVISIFFVPALSAKISKYNRINNCNIFVKNNPDTCQTLTCFITQKATIPNDFIKNKTVIDSTYLHKNGFFKGDTIYNINENYSAMIVGYSDGLLCSYKFILIVNTKTNVNTDCIIGATRCERDGENEYYSYSFSIKNSSIKIVQKHTEEGEEDAKVMRTTSYTVTDAGKLKKK